MKMLVCVKQVPASESAGPGDTALPDDFRMNRSDEYAVEEALLIREAFRGGTVEVVTVGPERAAEVLKRAVGMGADHATHILTPEAEFPDPFVTAALIAEHARHRDYDLILAGVMSEDMMQGQVGPMVAELLALPCATAVIAAQVAPASGMVYAEREIEGGSREMLEIRLPALLTLQTGINRPRYPALSHLLRAARQGMETVEAGSPGVPLSRQRVIRTDIPAKQRQGRILKGTPEQKADTLLTIFREKGLIP
ncbi:electron transfer flavoprotein subunit beta [Desulfonema ishimotonii]|uniref:Electron transfer flavoprotein subunit beta n=1 Tax=Desulfonema ishimotonii TaxID=45657 RepID=A0A401FQH7_9BACT|nr:electron transfer flavoprotein subunit beta/FixA family protein [Desulfonema ishimotonii]GBC59210.1 electron transfer flavoprotein subunit beta [Desulfonema ishimotonii]